MPKYHPPLKDGRILYTEYLRTAKDKVDLLARWTELQSPKQSITTAKWHRLGPEEQTWLLGYYQALFDLLPKRKITACE